MNSNWERVRTLFNSALDRPADLRASFLSEACADDAVTRREVESLLAAYGDSEGFLESAPIEASAADAAEPSPELEPGDRIVDFEVVGSLGAGGMGQVYRARDHTLHRDVAIKLLPRALAEDPDRLSRFERESRILAALNHPHIATIHSVEHENGRHALVMELVEGPTLAERLKGGALDARQALVFARELAGALEAAHSKGVVHRDLKPANIKFTASGSLKLLDFGVAKAIAEPDAAGPSRLPTDAIKSTDGLIVGTCAYMSPEQARGLPVDKRTDIWAFGCLLYEMLSGRRAFAGETVGETIKAVVEEQPDWTALPPATPPSLRRLMQRCLEKDPHHRLHDIADARIEIDELQQGESGAPIASPGRARERMGWVAMALVLAAGAVATGWWLGARFGVEAPPLRATRSTWALPSGAALSSAPAVSPDGRHIAFTASTASARSKLYVRPLSALDARAIPGTDGAEHPFWSPDGRFVAYFTPGKLMKVAIDGGGPVEICAARAGRGGAWNQAGVIVFSSDMIDSGLSRVSAAGGAVESATLLDTARGENSHRWPVFLPDGVHFLYFARSLGDERRGVFLGRIDRPATIPAEPLFRSESDAQYVPFDRDSGVLLSAANGHLEVRRFDPRRLTLIGDPTTLDLPVGALTPYHAAMFSASPGVLTYVAASIPYGVRFASVNRDGSSLTVREARQVLNWPRLSADGRRIVYQNLDASAGSLDLVVEDLERGTSQNVTKPGGAGMLPVWSPDGDRLAFVTGTVTQPSLVIGAADGTGTLSAVACPGSRCLPSDWSAAGLLATVLDDKRSDVWILQTGSGQTTRPLLDESYVERDARFSPDGSLVAYVSHRSGLAEVAIQRIDGAPARDVISVGGGDQPVWRRDGQELFYVDPKGALQVVSVSRGPTGRPVVGKPLAVQVPAIGFGHNSTQYDVSPDGRRIYFFDRRREPPPAEVGVVVGWRALIK